MPKLSTKITVKLEPELLSELHASAESEGKTISECVREAVINYVKERRTDGEPHVLRLMLTRYEASLIGDLLELGVVDSAGELFHRSFSDFVSGQRLRNFVETAQWLKGTKPVVSASSPKSAQQPPLSSTFHDQTYPEDGEDEGTEEA
ncbi:MAG: ribbon-helix-helix domain-containing protein [Thermoplasmatota archaeon]